MLVAVAIAMFGCSDSASDESSASTEFVADPNDTDDPTAFAITSTVTITETGFVPIQAVAVLGDTLTFVNETNVVQTIRFTNGSLNVDGPATLGPIEPGESLSYAEPLSSTISLIFESDGLPGQVGRLQVDPGIDNI